MNCCTQWHAKVTKKPLLAGSRMLLVGLDLCFKAPFGVGFYVFRPSMELQCYLIVIIFLSTQILSSTQNTNLTHVFIAFFL